MYLYINCISIWVLYICAYTYTYVFTSVSHPSKGLCGFMSLENHLYLWTLGESSMDVWVIIYLFIVCSLLLAILLALLSLGSGMIRLPEFCPFLSSLKPSLAICHLLSLNVRASFSLLIFIGHIQAQIHNYNLLILSGVAHMCMISGLTT